MGLLAGLVQPSVPEHSTFSSGPSFVINLSLSTAKSTAFNVKKTEKKMPFVWNKLTKLIITAKSLRFQLRP